MEIITIMLIKYLTRNVLRFAFVAEFLTITTHEAVNLCLVNENSTIFDKIRYNKVFYVYQIRNS